MLRRGARTALWLAAALAPAVVTASVRCPTGDSFGSIAFSESTGKTGKASQYCTRSGADRKAVSDCGEKDCSVQVWLDNNCGALASAKGAWAYAVGDQKDDTEALALQQCTAKLTPAKTTDASGADEPGDDKALASKKSKSPKAAKGKKPKKSDPPGCKVVVSLCSRSDQ